MKVVRSSQVVFFSLVYTDDLRVLSNYFQMLIVIYKKMGVFVRVSIDILKMLFDCLEIAQDLLAQVDLVYRYNPIVP